MRQEAIKRMDAKDAFFITRLLSVIDSKNVRLLLIFWRGALWAEILGEKF
jgi:hypothetical protein